MTRYTFGRDVLFGALELVADDLLCLQHNTKDRYFDVTFYNVVKYEAVRGRAVQLADTVLKSFQMVNLGRSNQRLVTVHVYNPWVPEEAIRRFLFRYVTVLLGEREVKDVLGLWTGKRQYRVLLADDPVGYDGYRHPPATFTIGADRGYLSYAGQPMYCRKCSTYGHIADDCLQRRCRNCDELGHIMADCTKAKKCSLCGSDAHLYRHCTEVGSSYAAAVRNDVVEAPASGQQVEEDISDDTLRDLNLVVAEIREETEVRERAQMETQEKERAEQETGEGTQGARHPGQDLVPSTSSGGMSWSQQMEEGAPEDRAGTTPEWVSVPERGGVQGRKRKPLNVPSPLETANKYKALHVEDEEERSGIAGAGVQEEGKATGLGAADDTPDSAGSVVAMEGTVTTVPESSQDSVGGSQPLHIAGAKGNEKQDGVPTKTLLLGFDTKGLFSQPPDETDLYG